MVDNDDGERAYLPLYAVGVCLLLYAAGKRFQIRSQIQTVLGECSGGGISYYGDDNRVAVPPAIPGDTDFRFRFRSALLSWAGTAVDGTSQATSQKISTHLVRGIAVLEGTTDVVRRK